MPGPRTDGFAITSFVVGILSVLCPCWPFFIFPTIGIVFGIIGLSRMGKQPDVYSGKGLAIAGIVLGGLAIVMMVVLLILTSLGSVDSPSWDDASGLYY